jgi:hypothetical protein
MRSILLSLVKIHGLVLRVTLVFVFAAVVSYQAAAVEPSAQERIRLNDTLNGFDASMRKMDMRSVFKALPPKILEQLRAKAKLSEDQLLDAVDKQFKEILSKVEIVEFKLKNENATFHDLGSQLKYAMVPTVTTARVSGKLFVSESQTLAILEQGNWYLMRTNEPHILAVLVDVYPEFSGVNFLEAKSKVISE